MKPIKGVVMNMDTKEVHDTDIYINIERVTDTQNKTVRVVSIGSMDPAINIQFTMKAYELREAIRDR